MPKVQIPYVYLELYTATPSEATSYFNAIVGNTHQLSKVDNSSSSTTVVVDVAHQPTVKCSTATAVVATVKNITEVKMFG